MTRWSLLRRRRRAQQPGPDAVRPDRIRPEDVRPELEPAVPGGYRPDAPASGGGHAPGAQRAATRRPDARARADAYAPHGAAPGPAVPGRVAGHAPGPGGGYDAGHAAGRDGDHAGHGGRPASRPAGPRPGFRPRDLPQPPTPESFQGGPRPAGPTSGAHGRGKAGMAAEIGGGAWPEVMERFGLRLLTLAEQMRMSLDELEADEGDPGRLQRLYRVDHAVTRMRRACRDLRTLAGRAEEELSGADTPLLDVIRMALSAIDRYTQVTIGRVAEFGVLGYAADDVASLLAALLDNATRYSPGVTSVSAHLTESGSLLFRISDSGIGMDPDGIAALNAMLAGDVPGPDDRTARHTGFPVVHRLARKHSIGVRLAARPAPGSGTIAMVTVPPGLICELPREVPPPPAPSGPPGASPPGDGVSGESSVPAGGGSVSVLPTGRRVPPEPPSGASREPGEDAAVTAVDAIAADPASGRTRPGLPRRERASLRGAGHPGGTGHPDGAGHPGDGAGPPAPPPAPPSAERLAAARHAFADDLTAFSLGAAPGSQVPGTRVPEPQDPGQGAPS